MPADEFQAYTESLKSPFIKLCRLRFLNPDGSTAFALDNDPYRDRNRAFIEEGTIRVNLQNGQRRTADVVIGNADGAFDYNVNNLWFGTEIALDEGLILQDGSRFYIQQGVFLLLDPVNTVEPNRRTVSYTLVDKWANLDGTLFGYLEATHIVDFGTPIFGDANSDGPITELLEMDRGNFMPVDGMPPVFTEYYKNKSQRLPDGRNVQITDTPYTLRVDSADGTIADVILGLTGMLNAWVGYDRTGRLRVDPSQDDILDTSKSIVWRFDMDETNILGATYTIKNSEVYNDYIVTGELMDDYSQPYGRVQNTRPESPTNINIIGRKTKRVSMPGFATDTQCTDYAEWQLKRTSILQQAVSISCGQILHINENELIEIVRRDKPGYPVEKHLVLGFSRPLSGIGEMTIDAVSVNELKFN